jgi:hypothetical protein
MVRFAADRDGRAVAAQDKDTLGGGKLGLAVGRGAELAPVRGDRRPPAEMPLGGRAVEAADAAHVNAKARGIGDDEVVRVFNARGACFAGVLITEAVRPGVVRLSCGAWYDPASDDDASACTHGNANVLTRDHGTSQLSQGPSSATALVDVEKCRNPPPRVRAFTPVRLTPVTG